MLRTKETDYVRQARRLARFMERNGLSQVQAAEQLGLSQSTVANKLRILKHPPEVLEALEAAKLTERHARTLLRLPSDRRQAALAVIARNGYTVARTEAYIEELMGS